MENQKVPNGTWNIRAVEGWNYKLNSITGEQRPSVFLQAQKLIEVVFVSWQPKSRELDSRSKRRSVYVTQEESIERLQKNAINKIICTDV
jgi:hypothetical protein